MMRRRGPGLVRGVARTAVVAGTATAVSGRVARRQAERYAEEQPAAAPPPPAPAAPEAGDQVAELQKLAQMQEQGLLTPEEFAAMKAKIIGS
jgi:succinate dehydrogenase/fumarate reductase flavoprotein subunit